MGSEIEVKFRVLDRDALNGALARIGVELTAALFGVVSYQVMVSRVCACRWGSRRPTRRRAFLRRGR